MKSIRLSIILLALMAFVVGATATTTPSYNTPSGMGDEFTEATYDLWIQGERVTSSNCNDFLWGMVSYDASSKTLSFNGDCWMNNDYVNDYAIVNGIADLKIQLNGNCGLEGMKGAIYSTEHIIISGNGIDKSSVMINDFSGGSITVYAEKGITIKECEVSIYGMEDSGIEGEGILTLDGSKLYCSVVKGFEDMIYHNGSYLTHPEDSQYDTVNKVLGGGNSFVQVDVNAVYELTVAGVEVTNENAQDILNDQTVSYNSNSKTLTLNNANIEYEAEVIRSRIDGLTIQVIGENVLTTQSTSCIDYQGKNLTIEGYTPSKSTLKFQHNSDGTKIEDGASYFSGNTLIKNCNVSGYAFMNFNTEEPVNLEMQRARITVANIEGFEDVKVSNSYIDAPMDCSYDKTQKCFVDGSKKVTSLHIEPYLLAYNGQDVTPSNPIATKSGVAIYDADARTLTMKNAELGEMTDGEGFAIFDDLTIKLEGTNKLSAKSAALRFEAGDLTIQGRGKLEIWANQDAFAESSSLNAYYFGFDQSFNLKNTTLYCWTYGRRILATNLIYNVNNSNFTFDKNPMGYEFIACKRMNLINSKLIEPAEFNLDKIYPMFNDKIVIEALGNIPGDLDGDGELDVADVTHLIKYLNDMPSGVDISVLDIDGDGTFTKKDIDALVDKLLER